MWVLPALILPTKGSPRISQLEAMTPLTVAHGTISEIQLDSLGTLALSISRPEFYQLLGEWKKSEKP